MLVLVSCASRPPAVPAPLTPGAGVAVASPTIAHGVSRWVPVGFGDLPGWDQDHFAEFWPALRRGCVRPMPDWASFCRQVAELGDLGDVALREWLQQRLQPYRVEASDGTTGGLLTG